MVVLVIGIVMLVQDAYDSISSSCRTAKASARELAAMAQDFAADKVLVVFVMKVVVVLVVVLL